MRPVLRGELSPADAVRAYHDGARQGRDHAAAHARGRPRGDRPRAAARNERRPVPRAGVLCAGSVRRRPGEGDRRVSRARPPGHDRAGDRCPPAGRASTWPSTCACSGRRSRSACSAPSATTSTGPSSRPSARGSASTPPGVRQAARRRDRVHRRHGRAGRRAAHVLPPHRRQRRFGAGAERSGRRRARGSCTPARPACTRYMDARLPGGGNGWSALLRAAAGRRDAHEHRAGQPEPRAHGRGRAGPACPTPTAS